MGLTPLMPILQDISSVVNGKVEAWKHQITSTRLRPARRDFAQADQITNKFQWSKFQREKSFFGYLKFGSYLGFAIWYLEFQAYLVSYAGLGWIVKNKLIESLTILH